MSKIKPVTFDKVKIESGFWQQKQKQNRDTTIYAVRDRFEDTGRIKAFACDWKEGMPQRPHFFWDSDVAKWMESVAYILQNDSAPDLEETVDWVVDQIEKNQDENGYYNIYFTVVKPEARWSNRDWHELYCAGHLIEAAIAYYHATGKDKFLKCMCKYADYIERVFVKEKSAEFRTPGHQEIELALVKLYNCTGEKRYLELAKHFIDLRGADEWENEKWDNEISTRQECQWHAPVREQKTAEGHCVRAGYMYTAMADLAYLYDDKELLQACETLFDDIYYRKMYITGGVGSTRHHEAFTLPYDLPNKLAYAESCAAISMAYFASRMLMHSADAKYGDIIERVMYNGFLSSTSLDGRRFFYENAMAIDLADRNKFVTYKPGKAPTKDPITERVEVFRCSCCPPNITRFVASVGSYLYTASEKTVWVHQYADSTAEFELDGGAKARIVQRTKYPEDGNIVITANGLSGGRLAVRIPSWAQEYTIDRPFTTEKGYAYIDCASDAETVTVSFEMKPVFVEADTRVIDDAGRVALTMGPFVYCIESVDNGSYIDEIRVLADMNAEVSTDPKLGVRTVTVDGMRRRAESFDSIYRPYRQNEQPVRVKFIPYYAFANRGASEMRVFVRI